VLAPLRQFGPPAGDTFAAVPYVDFQSLLEPGFPPGRQNYWKSNFLRDLSDEVIEILVEGFRSVPSPTTAIAIEQLGAAVGRVGEDDTAFSHREEGWSGALGKLVRHFQAN
jgi:hypothetical protein